MASTSAAATGGKITSQSVLYCAICSFPVEYCEFSSKSSKCKKWLADTHPEEYPKYYSDTALEDKLATLSVEQREALDKDLAKKEKKEEAKAEKEKKRIAASKVTIKRIERNKRKFITGVHGLEAFGTSPFLPSHPIPLTHSSSPPADIDLKKAAKLFANKFATGASVSKNPQGEDEIFIQGDVAEEVEDMILDDEDKKAMAVFNGKVEPEQVEVVDEGKLKKKNAG